MASTPVPASPITRICTTHFHGDHSLGLPGILQRISLDRVPHPVAVHYPAQGQEFYDRLRHATSYWDNAEIVPAPVAGAISRRLAIPTIGIGSGPETDGQVLVLHDLLGIGGDGPQPEGKKGKK